MTDREKLEGLFTGEEPEINVEEIHRIKKECDIETEHYVKSRKQFERGTITPEEWEKIYDNYWRDI
jgi:hypothetical protein